MGNALFTLKRGNENISSIGFRRNWIEMFFSNVISLHLYWFWFLLALHLFFEWLYSTLQWKRVPGWVNKSSKRWRRYYSVFLRLLSNGYYSRQMYLLFLIGNKITWLILPVVKCSPQRLSHPCLSITTSTVKLRMAH